MGNPWTSIIRAYLLPLTLFQLPYLEDVLNRFPDSDPILLGDLNADIGQLFHNRNQHISDFLSLFGLVDMMSYFRQRLHYWNGHIWGQVC